MSFTTLELPASAAADLLKAARDGYITLTRGGRPVAYIMPTSIYDEEDMDYMTDPAFWKMIAERRKDPTIPLEQVLKELEEREERESTAAKTLKKNGHRRKPRSA
jgi:antitoxin (DNA-binding transcriptional repressor) of toxin-antitoxin stability system